MKILMVLTSNDEMGDSGEKTGFWLEEFAAPYYVFKDAGAEVVLASPRGGQPPVDPRSQGEGAQTDSTQRFQQDDTARQALAHTEKLGDVANQRFEAVFYPGGHGPLWDLAEDADSIALIERTYANGTPLGLVCHAPGVLRRPKNADGKPLVSGLKVTGFSNSEEAAVGLTDMVPFLVEDALKDNGADYTQGKDWASHVVTAGHLVTGQNPASSAAAAKALLEQLEA